ncbi:MAG: tetratricopeptide repeat protein, partial [Halieaceae bacterium]|nr:tetratricopeptide repeat protein [Halieaceae bacterium]
MTEAQQQYRHWLAQSQSQPSNAIAWFNLGWWSTKVGLFAASLKAYEQALAFGIESPEEAMANMASVYSERLGQTEPAMQWLDRALLENPHYYPAIFNRAHIAEQMGDRETACRYFKLATELAPDEAYPVARWIEANLTLPEVSQAVQSLRQFAKAKDTDALMALARYEERAERYNAAWEALIAVNAVD